MELLLSFIAIVLYILDFKLLSGILGCVSIVFFILLYSRLDNKLKIFLPWIIISVLVNIFYVHYQPIFILSMGTAGAFSIWITSLIVWILHKFINY